MKVHSYWDIKSSSIIDKFLNGISEWSAEELQYQQNFPKDIENALSLLNGATANCIYSHGILLVPSYYSLSLRALLSKQFTRKGLQVNIPLTTTNAVALAKFADKQCEKTVAIVILQKKYIDLAILRIGDGIFEVKFTTGGDINGMDYKDKIYDICFTYLKKRGNIEDFNGIDECIIVSDDKVANNCISIIEQTFETRSILDMELMFLYKKGMLIQKGILDGTVKNALLLDGLPYPIYVDGNCVKQFVDFSIIPVRRSCIIDMPLDGIIAISEGNLLNRITIERYVFDITTDSEMIRLDVDIDANGNIKTYITTLTKEDIFRIKRDKLKVKLLQEHVIHNGS